MSNLKRIFKAGITDFKRNSWLSVATILEMCLVLFVIEGLLMFSVVTNVLVESLKDKVDISVYFKKEAAEQEILAVKSELENLSEVKTVEYISEERALELFKERYADNPSILESLDALDENPLEASLNIKAQDPGQYDSIASFLGGEVQKQNIDKITYFQNKSLIDRFNRIIRTIETSGLLLSLILAGISVLIAFNTIRLAIYTSREEIGIMKLVGATPGFARGPYLFEGGMYGLIAALASIILFYPAALLVSPKLSTILPEIDLAQYYLANVLQIGGLLILIGVSLGIISSFIAIRRYLKV